MEGERSVRINEIQMVVEGEREVDAAVAAGRRSSIEWARFTDSVDRLLDSSPAFNAALRQTFHEFQDAATLKLPANKLLAALQSLLQKLTKGVDPKAWKLSLRPFTYYDICTLAIHDSSFDPYESMDLVRFEWVARKCIKGLALNRIEHFWVFILGGIVTIHVLKKILKRFPYLGKQVGKFTNIIMPSILVGPILGFLAAIHWGNEEVFGE